MKLVYDRKRNKLKQRHNDILFGEMFYEFRESIKLAYSIKQKWFLYYKFKEKVEAIQWISEEAKRYAECDLHNFEEEHFPIWKKNKVIDIDICDGNAPRIKILKFFNKSII